MSLFGKDQNLELYPIGLYVLIPSWLPYLIGYFLFGLMPIVFKNKYEKEHSRVTYHTDPSPLINNPPAFRLQKPSTKDRAKGHCGHPLGIRSDTCYWFWGQVTIFWQIFHFTKSFICWLVLIELPLLTGTRTEHSLFKVAFYV